MKKTIGLLVLALAAFAPLAWAQVSPTNSTGVEPLYSYKGGLNEAINLSNGNLNINLPLLTLKGRAGNDLVISLSYDSRQMKFETQCCGEPENASWNYSGRMMGRWVANIYPYVSESSLYNGSGYRWQATITFEQGTKHFFDTNTYNPPPTKGVGKSTNATDMEYDFDAKRLRMKNGVWYDFSRSTEIWKGDSNGNYIKYIHDGNGKTTQIVDTLGRTVNIYYENATDPQLPTRLTVLNNAGQTLTYTFQYEFKYVNPEYFCYGSYITIGNYPFLNRIDLPDGKSWIFSYYHDTNKPGCAQPSQLASTALLSRIDYPMGGYSRYNYISADGLSLTNRNPNSKLSAKIVNSNADLPPVSGPAPGTPGSLVATPASGSQINVTWSASTGTVDHYEVERTSSISSPYTWVGNATTTSWTDNSVTSGTAYLYRVKAVGSSGSASSYSNIDLATATVFTDDPLVAGVTPIKAVHLTELRQAVNAVRTCAALAAASWTDPTITVGVTQAKAVHVQELRDNLNTARSTLGLSTLTFTDPVLTVGVTEIKKVHFEEVRGGVK